MWNLICQLTVRNNLDDEAIVAAIEKYVDEYLHDYAVMIDGTWGCGKTYFVLKTLRVKLKEHEEKKAESIKGYKKRNIIYTSLYDVKSTENISKKICMEGKLDLLNIVMIGLAEKLPGHDERYELHRLLGALLSKKLQLMRN